MDFKKLWPTAAMSLVAVTTLLSADYRDGRDGRNGRGRKYDQNCDKKATGPRCDRIDICGPCLPEAVNPSVRPFTQDACCCDEGEFSITVAGFYWQATEDGLDYAIENGVAAPTTLATTGSLATLSDAEYKNPDFKWKPGFKLGVGYNGTHDGWDLGLMWTHFNGRAKSHDSEDVDESEVLLPLWSAVSVSTGGDTGGNILFATDIETSWRLDLNLVDLELGREFYTSRYLTVRPHIGFRYASLEQHYEVDYRGGTFGTVATGGLGVLDEVEMKNKFTGGGVRGGLDTVWNFGCGCGCGNWGLFGNLALSLIYGRFEVEQEETTTGTAAPFAATSILDSTDHFRATRAMLDLALGIQWANLYNEDRYGLTFALAWEFHEFFNQNQLWRVNRIGDTATLHGENVFAQRRGDLSTQGVTFTVKLTF